jgi:hypothetical protein
VRRSGYIWAHMKFMEFRWKVKIMVHEEYVALIGLTFALITIISSYHLYVPIYAHKCTCLYWKKNTHIHTYMYMNTSTMCGMNNTTESHIFFFFFPPITASHIIYSFYYYISVNTWINCLNFPTSLL